MSTPIYRQVQDLRLYSLDSGCPKQECWAGYLPGPDAQITAAIYPAATWNDPGGVYLFLKEAPADFSAFLGNLNLLLPKLSPTGEVRILWIYNPNRDSAYWQWDMLKAQAAQGVEGLDWTVARQALFNIGNYTVAIQPGAAMTLDEDFNCAIAFAVDQVSFLGPNGVYPAQGYSVYRLSKVAQPATPDTARRQTEQQQVTSTLGQQEMVAYLDFLKHKAKVQILKPAGVVSTEEKDQKPSDTK